jgi:hypothetical protein
VHSLSNTTILAESESFALTHNSESCILQHKQSKNEVSVGDHYGNPCCGLIAQDESWCITGGEGLILWFQQGGMWAGFRMRKSGAQTNALQFKNREDIRWRSSFTERAYQAIHDMRLANAHNVRILLDPWSDYASTWTLDIEMKTLTKIADGPNMQGQPYTDGRIEF